MNLIKLAKKVVFSAIKSLYGILRYPVKIDENTILFISFLGKGYLCNPKYIHLEMLKDDDFKDAKFVWAVKDTSQKIDGAITVKYNSPRYFYYLAKSKIWIVNCKLPEYIKKKSEQVYIQTWHGTPLKRLAHDIQVKENTTFYRSKMSRNEMTRSYDVDVEKYDYIISPNSFTSEKYESAFRVPKDKIKEYGYARNDYLVNLDNNEISRIKDKYKIPKNKQVLLFCPTWRDNSFNENGYIFELECDFFKWKEKLKDKYIVLFKPHYLISNKFTNKGLEDFLYCIDENVDINELYAISDLLVTDYSSVFFDYSILNRPILFYMYDLEDYRDNLRGFYLDIYSELPGPIIENEDILLDTIRNEDFYDEDKITSFRKRFHHAENGTAAKEVLNNLVKPVLTKSLFFN